MAKKIKTTTNNLISFFYKVDEFLYNIGDRIL